MKFDVLRHRVRARIFQLLRHPERAAQEYRELAARDPESVTALNGLGLWYASQKQSDEAEQLFRQSLTVKAGQPLIWYNLGFLCDQQGRHEEAIAAFAQATSLAPRLDQAWYGLGHAYAALGRHAEAAAALEKAAALVPQNPFVWYSLGMAYHALGDHDRVTYVAEYLNRYDRRMTRQLIIDSGRSDLEHLIADYKPDFKS